MHPFPLFHLFSLRVMKTFLLDCVSVSEKSSHFHHIMVQWKGSGAPRISAGGELSVCLSACQSVRPPVRPVRTADDLTKGSLPLQDSWWTVVVGASALASPFRVYCTAFSPLLSALYFASHGPPTTNTCWFPSFHSFLMSQVTGRSRLCREGAIGKGSNCNFPG